MDTTEDIMETTAASNPTRRALLGAASGGFALAASGLFLPERLAGVAAREGANGGELGGRRGKDRKGRDQRKRRTHGDKKGKNQDDRGNAPGASLIRYTALRSYADDIDPYPGTTIDFYYRVKGKLDTWSSLFLAKTAENLYSAHADYAPERYSIAAYYRGAPMPTPVFVEVRNPLIGLPTAQIKIGGTIVNGEITGGYWITLGGDTFLPFEEGNQFTCWVGIGVDDREIRMRILRLKDSDTHKWFKTEVSWRITK